MNTTRRPREGDWLALAATAILLCVSACRSSSPAGPIGQDGAPPGIDVGTPFPIDRGDAGHATPGSYKGLWLRLVERASPAVVPAGGVIGVVCIGMSNASQECSEWITRLEGGWQAEVNPAVRVVNCAVGGHAIERWIDASYDATLWADCIDRKLALRGVSVDQVRVIYHKAANQFTTGTSGSTLPLYPASGSDYERFLNNLDAFAARVREKFPAVQAVYSSSRSYGGFAGQPGRGEPLSYEEGHALNTWLGAHASVDGVWYGWGAYIWAPDCSTGVLNGASVCYERADYQADGVHPAGPGRMKIARMMHERLVREAWYRR